MIDYAWIGDALNKIFARWDRTNDLLERLLAFLER